MEIHVVAVEARSPLGNYANTQASGLAMWPAAGAPLIVTTCNIKPGSTVTVAFSGVKLGDRQVVEAQLTASTRLRQASEAFLSLESRGWRCSDPGPSLGAGLHLHLLRLAADCQKPYHDGLSSCWSEPQEQWISRDVQLVFAPFGARSAQAANPLSLWTLVARGIVCNTSTSPGLLLMDATAENSAGGAVVLKMGRKAEVVAIMAPTLRSRSGDAVALGLAIPLSVVRETLLDDPACQAQLFEGEAASLAPFDLGLLRSWPSEQAREGVALLWLDSGSWASALVLSEDGHLLTCAHLLTGTSWMEPSKDGSPPRRSATNFPRCHGRCFVRVQGRTEMANFEADVLHIFDGFLDAALLIAKPRRGEPTYAFNPSLWKRQCMPIEQGIKVWAVGHGLFGPGSPWYGPAVTCGMNLRSVQDFVLILLVAIVVSSCRLALSTDFAAWSGEIIAASLASQCQGQLSKVVWGTNGRLAVLQSSAAVHRGCSGGALVAAETGELLGMVTTNAKQQDGAVLPHINFILPVSLLSPLFSFLETASEPGALPKLIQELEAAGATPEERGLWRLEPEHPNLPSRLLARKQHVLESLDELEKVANVEAKEEKEHKHQSRDRKSVV